MFEPLDFIARLAALVPLPRVHLTRYHGVIAPHSRLRPWITPAGRGGREHEPAEATTVVSRHVSMTWMQRLKRVFVVDIEHCRRCGGRLKIIASIEEPAVIERILDHLGRVPPVSAALGARAPPQWPLPMSTEA